ncbi:hypothetical protein FACS1894208_09800 [Clostridia bacterium]|nr:hypothetical protein FACS1894208_09800 [Clostridia bacterium]
MRKTLRSKARGTKLRRIAETMPVGCAETSVGSLETLGLRSKCRLWGLHAETLGRLLN